MTFFCISSSNSFFSNSFLVIILTSSLLFSFNFSLVFSCNLSNCSSVSISSTFTFPTLSKTTLFSLLDLVFSSSSILSLSIISSLFMTFSSVFLSSFFVFDPDFDFLSLKSYGFKTPQIEEFIQKRDEYYKECRI